MTRFDMYTRLLRKSAHIRRFTVEQQHDGWLISEEEDSRVVTSARYRDWHRVERAMHAFASKAQALRALGWSDDTGAVERARSTNIT